MRIYANIIAFVHARCNTLSITTEFSFLITSLPRRYLATQHLVHKQARVRVTTSGGTITSVLFYGSAVPASPFEVNVLPSRTCASLSTVADGGAMDSSHSLSIATAGLSAAFSITARDLFSNLNVLMSDNLELN